MSTSHVNPLISSCVLNILIFLSQDPVQVMLILVVVVPLKHKSRAGRLLSPSLFSLSTVQQS